MVISLEAWRQLGVLQNNRRLFVGDAVTAKFFAGDDEVEALRIVFKISTSLECEPSYWVRALLEQINLHIPFIKAGIKIGGNWLIGYAEQPIFALTNSGITQFQLDYQCIAQQKQQNIVTQKSDFVYPEGKEDYRQGTRVWQPKLQCMFQCKGWPFTEHCRSDHPEFEPGIGQSWQTAWEQE